MFTKWMFYLQIKWDWNVFPGFKPLQNSAPVLISE